MSVYTEVSEADLQTLLARYRAGELKNHAGIRDGIENTNYFVTTSQGEYVLTLFEHMAESEVQLVLELMANLSGQQFPCPTPLPLEPGRYISVLHGKPTSLVSRLSGRSELTPGPKHCQQIGIQLARFHLLSQSIERVRPNPRGDRWRLEMKQQLLTHLDGSLQTMLADEIDYQDQNLAHLPSGKIHGDLFRDNVLFSNGQLTGLLDLYDTCDDGYLYDLAITATDWCSMPGGELETHRLSALLSGYESARAVTDEEKGLWPFILRRAALRFCLSRLYSQQFPREGHLTHEKDPTVYLQQLDFFRRYPQNWPVSSTSACG